MVEAISFPARTQRSFSLYRNKMRDGTLEIMAFFDKPFSTNDTAPWCPMISVWAMTDDLDTTQEDVLTINGMHFAYCISDDTPSEFPNARLIADPSDIDMPTYMLALGMLTAMVI